MHNYVARFKLRGRGSNVNHMLGAL